MKENVPTCLRALPLCSLASSFKLRSVTSIIVAFLLFSLSTRALLSPSIATLVLQTHKKSSTHRVQVTVKYRVLIYQLPFLSLWASYCTTFVGDRLTGYIHMLNEPMGSSNQWMSDKITSSYLVTELVTGCSYCGAGTASRLRGLWGWKSLFCLQATQTALCMLI